MQEEGGETDIMTGDIAGTGQLIGTAAGVREVRQVTEIDTEMTGRSVSETVIFKIISTTGCPK